MLGNEDDELESKGSEKGESGSGPEGDVLNEGLELGEPDGESKQGELGSEPRRRTKSWTGTLRRCPSRSVRCTSPSPVSLTPWPDVERRAA